MFTEKERKKREGEEEKKGKEMREDWRGGQGRGLPVIYQNLSS
jgi:hypothetical protein